MRPVAQVRPARPDDLDDLVGLCLTARRETTAGAALCTDDAARLRDQLGVLLTNPGACVLLGALDGRASGLLLARVVGPSPFTDSAHLTLEAVYVLPTARRRGLGHALLGGALDVAAQAGATELYATPLPGARGMHRFLARLGFAPAAAHRVVSTQLLQRRLAHEPGLAAVVGLPGVPARRGAPRGLEDLIARRRQARESRQAREARQPRDTASRRDAGQLREPRTSTPTSAAGQRRASISMQVSRAVQRRRPPSSSTTT